MTIRKLEKYLDDYLKELNDCGGQLIKEELGVAFFNRAVVQLQFRGQCFFDDEGRFFDKAKMEIAIAGPSYAIPSGLSKDELRQWMIDCVTGKVELS